jgi:hypothetical protein
VKIYLPEKINLSEDPKTNVIDLHNRQAGQNRFLFPLFACTFIGTVKNL